MSRRRQKILSAPPAFRSKIYIYYVCFHILHYVLEYKELLVKAEAHFWTLTTLSVIMKQDIVYKKTRQNPTSELWVD